MAFQDTYASFAAAPPLDPSAPALDLFVCRACLATDIKLFDIQECDLAPSFEAVTGLPVPANDGLPQHLCPFCFVLLEKCSTFIQKCKHSLNILGTLEEVYGPITTDAARLVDRTAEGLAQTLSEHSKKVESINIAPPPLAKRPVQSAKRVTTQLHSTRVDAYNSTSEEESENIELKNLSHKEVPMDCGALEDNPFAMQGATVFRSAAKAVVRSANVVRRRHTRGHLQKALMESCVGEPACGDDLKPPPPLELPPSPPKLPRRRNRFGDDEAPPRRQHGARAALPAGYPGCAAALQHALRLRGASLASLAVLPGSFSAATFRQYDRFYRLWWRFCGRRALDPYRKNMPAIIEYLTERLNNGLSTFTARANRGALALLLGKEISRDEELSQLIKSYFRPDTGPRYTGTWDPNLLLNCLADMYPNSELPLDQISKKLVALIALSTCHIKNSLARVQLDDFTIEPERVKFRCRRQKTREVYVSYYREDPRICPVVCLLDYLRMTETIRPAQCNFLIINVKRPYAQAAGQTIMRWLHRILAKSGVEMSVFEGRASEAAGQFKNEFVSFDGMRKQAEWHGPAADFLQAYRANW